jgi:hypothetical protein
MKTNNKNTESGLQNRIAQSGKQAAKAWRAIFFRGPQPAQNKDGDEIPLWSVYLGDEEGEPVRTVYGMHSFKKAESLAKVMAEDRKLELIHEAQHA